jgi:hypothetical protein
MFGKKKCNAAPVFKDPVHAATPEQARTAVAALECPSGAALTPGALTAPSAAALVKAAQLPDAVWMYGQRLECSRCKKSCDVTISVPDAASPPNPQAVRAKARPDFYALQHAFLPEWFLTKPEEAISLLSTKLDGWQAATMKQIGGIVARTAGEPMPIVSAQVVGTPGETTSLLLDFITPSAPVEAHYALLVGGASPRYLLSEKTHMGEDRPVPDMAGLTEWAFANAARTDMKHTAIDLLPDTSRTTFFMTAVELLKRRLA